MWGVYILRTGEKNSSQISYSYSFSSSNLKFSNAPFRPRPHVSGYFWIRKEWKNKRMKERKKERKKEREKAYPNIIRDPPKTRHPDKSMKKAPNFVIWKIEFKIYLVNKIKVSVILNISLNSLFAVFRPNFLWFRGDSKALSL